MKARQRTVIAIVALATLTACQSIPEAPTVVKVPYAVPCIAAEDMPARPKLATDAELLTMPDAAFVLALAADRLERSRYMALTDALLTGCIGLTSTR